MNTVTHKHAAAYAALSPALRHNKDEGALGMPLGLIPSALLIFDPALDARIEIRSSHDAGYKS